MKKVFHLAGDVPCGREREKRKDHFKEKVGKRLPACKARSYYSAEREGEAPCS